MDLVGAIWATRARVRYGLALGLSSLAVLGWAAVRPYWGPTFHPVTLLPAVLLSGWLGGVGPGLLATAVCAVAAAYWLPSSVHLYVSTAGDRVAVGLFLLVGALISGVLESLHRTRRRLQMETVTLAAESTARARLASRLRDVQTVVDVTIAQAGVKELLGKLVSAVREAVKADGAAILLADEQGRALQPVAWDGLQPAPEQGPIPLKHNLHGRIAAADEGLVANDLAGTKDAAFCCGARVQAMAGVALRSDGHLIGLLEVVSIAGRRFTREDQLLLRLVADRAALAIVRTRLSEAENAARAAAEAASRAKDEFLAMLGHELRNPLSAIAIAVELLDEDELRSAPARRARGVIERQCHQLKRMVDDLLDVARVTAGKVSLSAEPLELGEVVARCVESVVTDDTHRVSVTLERVWVVADRVRIEQVVTNLLHNAVKYTPAGGAIHVAVGPDGDRAQLRISDEGVGMSPELLQRAFDLFVQGPQPSRGAGGGLGIGLALVQRLVDLHQGTVAAASEGPGRGSTFTVRLPRVAAPSRTAPERHVPSASHRRILLVEDNADARTMLQLYMESLGHEVYGASDGEHGVELARTRHPEVAFIDIGLPGADGYKVASQIRTMDGGAAVTLVALSGATQDQDRSRQAGFDAHLVKPVDPEELVAVLEH
jgi:signal transduction histidine kinase